MDAINRLKILCTFIMSGRRFAITEMKVILTQVFNHGCLKSLLNIPFIFWGTDLSVLHFGKQQTQRIEIAYKEKMFNRPGAPVKIKLIIRRKA